MVVRPQVWSRTKIGDLTVTQEQLTKRQAELIVRQTNQSRAITRAQKKLERTTQEKMGTRVKKKDLWRKKHVTALRNHKSTLAKTIVKMLKLEAQDIVLQQNARNIRNEVRRQTEGEKTPRKKTTRGRMTFGELGATETHFGPLESARASPAVIFADPPEVGEGRGIQSGSGLL